MRLKCDVCGECVITLMHHSAVITLMSCRRSQQTHYVVVIVGHTRDGGGVTLRYKCGRRDL